MNLCSRQAGGSLLQLHRQSPTTPCLIQSRITNNTVTQILYAHLSRPKWEIHGSKETKSCRRDDTYVVLIMQVLCHFCYTHFWICSFLCLIDFGMKYIRMHFWIWILFILREDVCNNEGAWNQHERRKLTCMCGYDG